jgi:hypothetical protein
MVGVAADHCGQILFPPSVEIEMIVVRNLSCLPGIEGLFHDEDAQAVTGVE